jgi:hypothetical protein
MRRLSRTRLSRRGQDLCTEVLTGWSRLAYNLSSTGAASGHDAPIAVIDRRRGRAGKRMP